MSDDLKSLTASWTGFLPPHAVVMARREIASPLFQFIAPGRESSEAGELFTKILSALDLCSTEYHFGENPSAPAKFQIAFTLEPGETGAGEWDESSIPTLKTFSLSAMLREPGLKKTVWSDLKQALKRARGQTT